jgi:transposase InsO family protein
MIIDPVRRSGSHGQIIRRESKPKLASMGSIGDCYDNAMCESFFATLECELLDRRKFKTNQRWSLDFVSDALFDGRRFRILYVIDDFSRECLATIVDASISGIRVARELDRIAEMRGFPCMVVSDTGTELTSNAMLKWQEDRQV